MVPDGHALASGVGSFALLGQGLATIPPGEHENASLPLRLAVTQSTNAAILLFRVNASGDALSLTRLKMGENGLPSDGSIPAEFGSSVTSLGDVDGDGLTDIGVGTGAANSFEGNVAVLFMHGDSDQVKAVTILDHADFNPGGLPAAIHLLGASIAGLGRLDDDDIVPDMAIGAPYSDYPDLRYKDGCTRHRISDNRRRCP